MVLIVSLHYTILTTVPQYPATPFDALLSSVYLRSSVILVLPCFNLILTYLYPHGGLITLSRRLRNDLFCCAAILRLFLSVINAIIFSSGLV
jgi:hypothetical protein